MIEGPMPGDATLFVHHLNLGHGDRDGEDEIVIDWELGEVKLIGP